MSPVSHVPASVANTPEFQMLAADARRWRFLRRYLVRGAPSPTASGSVLYHYVLETAAPIDAEELDRIVEACRASDDGQRTAFMQGGAGANRLGGEALISADAELQLEPESEHVPIAAAKPRREKSPPLTCRCGAVRPPTRGRPPATWDCGAHA